MLKKSKSESAKDFVLESALLSSSFLKQGSEIDLKDVVTDIDIYEHLDKPYITGTVTFVDNEDIYSAINFYGIEKFSLTVRLPEPDFPLIRKNFYVDKVVRNIRTNDGQTVIVLHIIEDIGYLSEFINVNKSYINKGYKIVSDILREYLGKQLSKPNNDPTYELRQDNQPVIQVVVPNMRPLKAADWIKDRLTTEYGTPFYLFSTLVNDKMHLVSLTKMLDVQPLNTRPFMYSQGLANSALSVDAQMFNIERHNNPNTDELLKLNSKGFVNSMFIFHDVTTNQTYYAGQRQSGDDPSKNVWTAYDMFGSRAINGRALGNIPGASLSSVYPLTAELPERATQEELYLHRRRESKVVSNIVSSELFASQVYGLQEGRNRQDLVEIVDSKAFRHWVVNSSIDFTVPGRFFLYGDRHRTIGNKLQLAFSIIENENTAAKDEKKSGEYLIYAARHSFAREGYVVHLTGVKLIDNLNIRSTYRAPNVNESPLTYGPRLAIEPRSPGNPAADRPTIGPQ
jgi:hypothetical protein